MGTDFADQAKLVDALRRGEESAFAYLLDTEDRLLRVVARRFVSTDAAVSEVVADTWLAVIEGIDRFEGRSTIRTWLVRILMNKARTRGVRDARSVPFASLIPNDDDLAGFDTDQFRGDSRRRYPGHWTAIPADWSTMPAERFEASITMDAVRSAIAALPESQRAVIVLRDVEGWSSGEICDALDLTDSNERVLLHRARGAVRRALSDQIEAWT